MKQYRLKITWSNGDSEYVGPKITSIASHLEERLQHMAETIKAGNLYLIDPLNSYNLSYIRKFEFEEVHQERSEKF